MFMSKATFLTCMLFYFELYSEVKIFLLIRKTDSFTRNARFSGLELLISLNTIVRKFELFYRFKIWLLLLTSSVVKKLSDNLNWIDKSSSGTYHKYALCTRVWKWLLKQAPHCAPVIFLRPPDYIYLKTKSANDMPRRWSLKSISTLISTLSVHRGMIISAQFWLLNLLHYQIL